MEVKGEEKRAKGMGDEEKKGEERVKEGKAGH